MQPCDWLKCSYCFDVSKLLLLIHYPFTNAQENSTSLTNLIRSRLIVFLVCVLLCSTFIVLTIVSISCFWTVLRANFSAFLFLPSGTLKMRDMKQRERKQRHQYIPNAGVETARHEYSGMAEYGKPLIVKYI